jgi:uncharacterized protein YkwD
MRKLLLKLILFGGIGFALLLTYIFGFTNGTKFAGANYIPESYQAKQISEDRLFKAVNQWRESQNKQTYITSPVLCGFATQRVKEIQSDWSHDGFKELSKTGEVYKFQNFSQTGENILRDFSEENGGLESWLNSPTHRANLDSDFTHSCIRCENNYCVQLFGKY